MKAAFIGSVDFSHAMLSHLLTLPDLEVVGVVTRRHSTFNADFRSLEEVARSRDIPCFIAEGNNQEAMATALCDWAPEVIFCLGWSYLLRSEILSLPRFGVIGYHPAPLPLGRGRHPIIWALALGLAETASTFFIMDDGADSGDIVSQVAIPLSKTDDAASLYRRLEDTARTQLTGIAAGLSAGTLARSPQESSRATYWRKRGKTDGQIDWRMPARSIHNLVRALTRPYVGAHCLLDGAEAKVWSCRVEPGGPPHLEPGRVLAVDGVTVVVQCGDSAVRLVQHELPRLPAVGECL